MNCQKRFVTTLIAAVGLAALIGAPQIATAAEASGPTSQPEMKLPPGWTAEDMQTCMAAATPGKMQEHLTKDVGTWEGKNTMWMAPGVEPTTSDCKLTVTSLMDGRFAKYEMNGEMPGMGPYHGGGVAGYDNVAQKYVAVWIDNQSTGIMTGTGDLSSDGKVMTWNYTTNCPLTKKPTTVREVDTYTSPTTMKFELFGIDPKSGKEFKMMNIEFAKNQ